jgi:hypothetical protein
MLPLTLVVSAYILYLSACEYIRVYIYVCIYMCAIIYPTAQVGTLIIYTRPSPCSTTIYISSTYGRSSGRIVLTTADVACLMRDVVTLTLSVTTFEIRPLRSPPFPDTDHLRCLYRAAWAGLKPHLVVGHWAPKSRLALAAVSHPVSSGVAKSRLSV